MLAHKKPKKFGNSADIVPYNTKFGVVPKFYVESLTSGYR